MATGADASDESIDIVRLAPDEWRAYRSLRLCALQEEPQAFGTSYAEARARPDTQWREFAANAAEGRASWLLFARRGARLVGLIGAFLLDPPDGLSGSAGGASERG